ncbi:MAG: response regulator [Veillonellaceae bacterium]|jgi:diguanylate cyclase (GGDEF)-like protein|nr:response regulator [Veillonellaceae bacterium]
MPVISPTSPREIAPGVFWVGAAHQAAPLNCNPYLLVEGKEAVLIDPGSPLDFPEVLKNVQSLVSLSQIKYIVLQHQDPDFCAATPLFEQAGFVGQLATHWRSAHLIKYYGVTSSFYLVNEHNWELSFGNNRKIMFVPTPYLHFPGAIASYDPYSRVLFSSDLFGAFADNCPLFADEWPGRNYQEAMRSFHEHYMPSNTILRPVMENFAQFDIACIAPQHGSVIRQGIAEHIGILRELECGSFLNPIRRSLSSLDGYTQLVNQLLKRLYVNYSRELVAKILATGNVTLSPESGELADFNCSGHELWDLCLQLLYDRLGFTPLFLLEPLIKKLSAEYSIEPPYVFKTMVLDLEKKAAILSEDNLALQAQTAHLTEQLQLAAEKLMRCSVTNLRNEQVFFQYLADACQDFTESNQSGTLLFIGVDNMAKINLNYGNVVGDQMLQTLSLLIEESIDDNHVLFKLDGPIFACYVPKTEISQALPLAEKIRYRIEQTERLIERITVSIAVISLRDFFGNDFPDCKTFAAAVTSTGKSRLLWARQQGGNQVLQANTEMPTPVLGKIVIVDTDEIHLEVLGTLLRDAQYTVFIARDGDEAYEIIDRELPELIISEVILPKTDGFLLRQRLRMDSGLRDIPFILVSFQKNEEAIRRAFALDIGHYLQKPYIMTELIELVQLLFRQRSVNLQ